MKLSIIVPGIRVENWERLYDSIDLSSKWEIIFVGPRAPLFERSNMAYFHSLRSPNSCQQFALGYCSGEHINFAADDGIFLPNALDEAFHLLDKDNYKSIVVGRYLEGDNPIGMTSEDYYRFKYHKPYRLAGINPEWLIFNCGLISRKLILELGGYDAENFEVTTVGHADLSIRAQKAGANMILMKEPMFKCSHQPGKSGDHKPIHIAQTKRDLPKFQQMYAKPNDRVNIDLNNWQHTEEVWKGRFGK